MSNPLATETIGHIPDEKRPRAISWYRTPLAKEALRDLHERSDLLGALQTFGYIGLLLATGSLAYYAAGRWPWWAVAALFFAHGTCFAFQINAVHELGHGTVFKTKWLNSFFESVFAFLGWINHKAFDVSHVRHHQYTLHPPDDLEVVLPIRLMAKHFFTQGFVNLPGMRDALRNTVRRAGGAFEGEWTNTLFPASQPEKRQPPVRWARTLLAGHGLIVAGAVTGALMGHPKLLLVPVLVTFGSFYGGWLLFLCNNTQHMGLKDNVNDFRICCRTIELNPFVQFLYWHMNYHIEHHMYAAVPCYKLGKLHRLIQHDLPETKRGLVATWREIAEIQRRQNLDPTYQFMQTCPAPAPTRS